MTLQLILKSNAQGINGTSWNGVGTQSGSIQVAPNSDVLVNVFVENVGTEGVTVVYIESIPDALNQPPSAEGSQVFFPPWAFVSSQPYDAPAWNVLQPGQQIAGQMKFRSGPNGNIKRINIEGQAINMFGPSPENVWFQEQWLDIVSWSQTEPPPGNGGGNGGGGNQQGPGILVPALLGGAVLLLAALDEDK